MSRLGVTFEEVAGAAHSLQQKGESPTIDKVRTFLGGTGSNTTISKYLQLWRNQNQHGLPHSEDKAETPDVVKVAVERVWQEMREQTDAEVETIKAQAQKIVEETELKARAAESNLHALQSTYDTLLESHHAQSAEKELLLLDVKKRTQEEVLLQERCKALEIRFTDMQTLTSQHLKDLANSHKNEVIRLEDALKAEVANHAKLVDEIKSQSENERHQHIVVIDNLKIENKRLNETISKLQTQLQEKLIHATKLEMDLKKAESQREDYANRLVEQENKWTHFNDKTLVSKDVIKKIYDAPRFDLLIDKFNSVFTDSMDKKFFEFKNWIQIFNIEDKVEAQDE